MAQELVTETDSVTGALNKTWDISHYERTLLVYPYHAENGRESGEVIVRDFRLSRTYDRDKGRFSDIREAYESNVRKKLKLKSNLELLARKSRLSKTRDLSRRSGKVNISLSSVAALCDDLWLVCGHIRHNSACFCITHYSSARNFYNKRRSALARAIARTAVLALLCGILSLIAEIYKGRKIVVHLKDNVSASAAVAAVRTARSHIFFTVKGNSSVTAIACFDLNFRLIDKHFTPSCFLKRKSQAQARDLYLLIVTVQRKQKPSYGHVRNART